MLITDEYKKYKRIFRSYLLRALLSGIEALPVKVLPKLKLLLLKVFPVFWKKELLRAEKLLPEEFAQNKNAILKKMLENQVLTILEVLFYEKLVEAKKDFVTVVGKEHLKRALDLKRGIIILTAHYCNWELLGYELVKMGLPLIVVARAQAVSQMTELMNSYRNKRGVRVLMSDTVTDALSILKSGGALGLLTDLNAREHGYQVEFFGKKASFYSTPVVMSVRSGAPVVPTFIERSTQGNMIIRFEEPLKWAKDETMKQRIQKYAICYEKAFRNKPQFWCWFHERYQFAELGKAR